MAKTPARERLRLSWYGGSEREVEVVSGTGHWYRAKQGLVEVRWVFVHDVEGTHRDEYFFSTELSLSAQEVVQTYTRRWNLETTFEEMRSYIGLETTRGRKKETVLRVEPCLFGLYSVVACLYSQLPTSWTRGVGVKWRGKKDLTFSDAITAVRRWLWVEWVFLPGRRSGVVRETAAGVAGGDLEWSGPCGLRKTCGCRGQGHRIRVFCGPKGRKTPDSTVRSARPALTASSCHLPFTSSFGIKWAKVKLRGCEQNPSPPNPLSASGRGRKKSEVIALTGFPTFGSPSPLRGGGWGEGCFHSLRGCETFREASFVAPGGPPVEGLVGGRPTGEPPGRSRKSPPISYSLLTPPTGEEPR